MGPAYLVCVLLGGTALTVGAGHLGGRAARLDAVTMARAYASEPELVLFRSSHPIPIAAGDGVALWLIKPKLLRQ
jgi:hypothetical protein